MIRLTAIIYAFLLTMLLVVAPAYAQTTDVGDENISEQHGGNGSSEEIVRSVPVQEKYDLIQEILSGEDFGTEIEKEGWRFKDWRDKSKRNDRFPEWFIWFMEIIESNETSVVGISKVVEALLWALLIGLTVFVLYRYRKQLQDIYHSLKDRPVEKVMPSSMFGMDIKVENMPKDVVTQARQHWQSGQPREALALLLGGSLFKLLHDYDCVFYSSDTERECCARVDLTAPELQSNYLRELVNVWQALAYGHQPPSDQQFDRLCELWREVFKT